MRLYPSEDGWKRSRLNISSGAVVKNGPTASASDTTCAPSGSHCPRLGGGELAEARDPSTRSGCGHRL